ncbi:addiction module toxin RelE [Candidatus Falkowbacteria bacterium CG_4_9_14_3_um_filter_36_9]|uniref:Addiction module toxin RelE n=2 Tax=Candidatus Falkowiibacteriota TaxID=1752728 RepID=A0A1J4T6E4_9BACT|nr:MAG: hypothetical protein AUJ27_02035 [Candidatus Falkowbacteria bacterium CG1_02_37_44]PIV51430.1 MAG: addiction module toxin RelE [Candidatus Falkowbacteria bacterium CG02_land_8_20_14_3_00_36_14]PIX11043.1 MAG: addiction module toxin RelE [Candidatus Falkowbacteria bacterium CG_4_8_14_3_um_filter_36_11]PJA10207.1 MAG: addiction module toxin RelE [Candidatus Falkowbacteria bacterium CG_4_10_14_0_2_um_filter_36_22]PJB18413.1 MAG: addiction module toxin RelE [Candidatus Falkowbacteria bacter
MRLIGKEPLYDFMNKYSDSRSQIESWIAEVEETVWQTPHELKCRYSSASIIGGQNVVFNICGNKYRLWVKTTYKIGVVLIKKIGTHDEYIKWNIR